LRAAVEGGAVPGVAAAVVTAEGTLHRAAFGAATVGGAAMVPDTVCWLASMTKALTAAAVMQQVEQGRLSLDAPAAEVLPYLGQVPVLHGFDGDGRPDLRPARTPITLRHLLTHTSGFAYGNWQAPILRYVEHAGLPATSTCKMEALRTPLLFEPGTGWAYGIGIDWAGQMLERVTGMRLNDYLVERLFRPLGMHDSSMRISPAMEARRARVHTRRPEGGFEATDTVLEQEPEFDMGGGAVYGTAEDYARFVAMILNRGTLDGVRVLEPGTVDEMARNQIGALRVQPLVSAAPDLTSDAEFFPGIEKTWGLSFMINETQAPTGRSAGSLAWAGLANSYFWIDPAKGVGGVWLAQLLPFADPRALEAFYAFERAVYDSH
jgi:CubicO group peptidase (beta-lactamase class C family)